MKSILGIGNAVTDIPVVLQDGALLEEMGYRPGSMNHIDGTAAALLWERLQGLELVHVPGGSAANTVSAAVRLGMKGGFIGKVGRDSIGDMYVRAMEQDGVGECLLRGGLPSAMAVTFITSDDGERTFATYLGAALELSAQELPREMFGGYACLHVEGYLMQCGDVVEKAVGIARERGMKISFDMGSCGIVRRFHSRVRRIVEDYADIVFANGEEAEAFTGAPGEEALEVLRGVMPAGDKVAVVKLGAEGSLVADGSHVYRIAALPADVVDTTGAGDAYAAGFLYAHSMGAGLEKCGEAGSVLASRVVSLVGPKISKSGWKAAKAAVDALM